MYYNTVMNKDDLIYICRSIGDLSGIPVRLYKNRDLILYHSLVKLEKDPLDLYKNDVLEIDKHVGYYTAPDFSYYGVLNANIYKIVIGPTRQTPMEDYELKELAFRLDVENTNDFIKSMKNIICFPLDSLMQTLCVTNFALNKEKYNLEDIVIADSKQEDLFKESIELDASQELAYSQSTYNSKGIEDQLMTLVESGNTTVLKEWLKKAPAIRPGILSKSMLRQYKNIFIVSVTLASRSAIKGGLSEDVAFKLSDDYIQKCELLNDMESITNLEYHMILDYTKRVERVKFQKTPSKLVVDVANYISKHIYDHIEIDDLSNALYISKSWLFAKFKEDTGMTIKDYILKEKIEEAKRLLSFTDKPSSAISSLLSFSSQSHFNRTFLKYVGETPGEYRRKKHY